MQPAWLMEVVTGEAEIRFEGTGESRAPTIRIVIIAGLNRARTIGQLANRSKMITSVIVVGRTNPHSLRIVAFRDVVARVTLLAWLRIARAPDELLRARDAAV